MSDPLRELADDIRKGGRPFGSVTYRQQGSRAAPAPPRRDPIVAKAGPGGVIFNFNGPSGHWFVDRYNNLLKAHADPTQAQIANDQRDEFGKALGRFVDVGEHQFALENLPTEDGGQGVHSEWNSQLNRSMDSQVVEAFNKGALSENSNQSAPAGGSFPRPGGNFAKSTISVGGDEVVAASETDAALIEMMKSGGMTFD